MQGSHQRALSREAAGKPFWACSVWDTDLTGDTGDLEAGDQEGAMVKAMGAGEDKEGMRKGAIWDIFRR